MSAGFVFVHLFGEERTENILRPAGSIFIYPRIPEDYLTSGLGLCESSRNFFTSCSSEGDDFQTVVTRRF